MNSSKKIITKLTAAGLSAALALSSFGMTVMAAGLSNPEMSDKYCEISDYDSSIIANQYYDAIIALRDGLLDHSESINVSSFKIPSTAVSAFYDATLSLCPELFFTKNNFSYSYTTSGGTKIISKIIPNYLYSESETNTKLDEFYTSADFYLDQISDELSACKDDFSKATLLHDEIALEGHYVIPDSSNYTMMVQNFGKCENYTRVYAYLLGQIGIRTEIIDSSSMNHEWMKICLGGKYYNVDLTWDDPTYDRPGLVSHDYFLLSDSAISSDHSGYKTINNSTDTKYDNYTLHKFNSKLCKYKPDETIVYAVNSDTHKIVKYNYATNSSQTVIDLSDTYWKASNGGMWSGIFSGMDIYDGVLYYNIPDAIMSYDLSTGKKAVVFSNTFNNELYGIRIRDGKLYGVTAPDPNTTGSMQLIKQLVKKTVDVSSVSLDKTTLSLTVGSKETLTASLLPANATNKTISWNSGNTSVATVNNGTVTAVAPGTAVITASSNNGKTAKCTVTVLSDLANKSYLSKNTVYTDTPITIYGSASGGTSPYKYAFYYKRSTNTKWKTIGTEFGSASSASFSSSYAVDFDIKVIVKDNIGTIAEKLLKLSVTENQSFKNNSWINTEIAQIGDDVRVTGDAQGGTGSYTYAFYFKRSSNSKWNKIGTEFGTKKYGVLVPSAADSYDMKVIAKDETGNTVSKIFTVRVVESLALTNISTISATSVAPGRTVTLAGRFIGGKRPCTFEYFFKRSSNSKWNKISYGNEAGTYAKFTPSATAEYDLKVIVYDSTGTKSVKTFKLTSG